MQVVRISPRCSVSLFTRFHSLEVLRQSLLPARELPDEPTMHSGVIISRIYGFVLVFFVANPGLPKTHGMTLELPC